MTFSDRNAVFQVPVDKVDDQKLDRLYSSLLGEAEDF